MPPDATGRALAPTATFAPRMDLAPNTVLRLGKAHLPSERWIVRQRVAASGGDASRVEIENLIDNSKRFLSDAELADLAGLDEIHVEVLPGGVVVQAPPPRAARTDAEDAHCRRCMAYVRPCLGLSRSRPVLEPVIGRVAEARDEEPPHFNTVNNWLKRWHDKNGQRFGDSVFERDPHPGNRRKVILVGDMATAVFEGVIVSVRLHKGSSVHALSAARAWHKEHRPEIPVPKMPCVRTINYEVARLNRYIKEEARYGREAAERRYRGYSERPRPALPLMEVEVDHTLMDILLLDESRSVVFGRPVITTLRDRCTGCVLGMSIGYEKPSYTAFLAALEHAFFSKDMREFPAVKTPWFCFGRPKMLIVDNGMEFIGGNAQHAAENLDIELVECPPGTPWFKGAQEGLFRILGRDVQSLPGSVFSNVEERKRYAETGQLPVLTLTELRAFLTYWICDVYHPNAHEGLGFLRTLKDVPERLWRERIGNVRMALPPPRHDFMALAGDADWRAVTDKGIRWDHVRYEHDDLRFLRTHPDHRTGREEKGWEGVKYQGSRYRVVRNPNDIGTIVVVNPYKEGPRLIEVPAVRLDYANGLALHHHRIFVANNAAKVLQALAEREDLLIETRDAVNATLVDLMRVRGKFDVQRIMARFVYAEAERVRRSVVTTRAWSEEVSSELMDPFSDAPMDKPATRSPDAAALTPPTTRIGVGAPLPIMTGPDALPARMDSAASAPRPKRGVKPAAAARPDDDDDDFDPEELRRRMRSKGWS